MNSRKMMQSLIFFAILMFVPLTMKLFSYMFYSSSKVVLKKNLNRADIVDAQGNILATTIPTKSVYIIPSEILQFDDIVRDLSAILNVKPSFIASKLKHRSKKFVWILRHISPWQAQEVANLKYDGVYIFQDVRRFYPSNSLFAHVVGRVDDANNGITGIEAAFNNTLKNQKEPLKLSLNANMQMALKDVLDETKKHFKAKSVNGMLINAKDGAVIAMYSQIENYDVNPHEDYKLTGENINLNTQVVRELGSIFKIVNIAMLLENNLVDMNAKLFAPKVFKYGKHKITDVRRFTDCYYTFEQAFVKSSNIVNGIMALNAGLEKQIAFFDACGFFDKMDIDGLKVSPNLFPKKWKNINGITASYGHGIAVTNAHFLRAVLRIITGKKKELHIVQYNADNVDEKLEKTICSKKTSKTVLELMRKIIKDKPIEKKYKVAGYQVAGKSGTGNKLSSQGTYMEKKNYCSYLFVFPADDPKIIGLITLDEPMANAETFGFATAFFIALPAGLKLIKHLGPIAMNSNN